LTNLPVFNTSNSNSTGLPDQVPEILSAPETALFKTWEQHMPPGFPAFPSSRFPHDRDSLSQQRSTKAMIPNDTASIASTSTFASTVSLIKKKFTPSTYKYSYSSTTKSDKKEKKATPQNNSEKLIFEVGIGAGSSVYTPYRASYPGEAKRDSSKCGPESDFDEKKVDEESGDVVESVEEKKIREKEEKKKRKTEKRKADMLRPDRDRMLMQGQRRAIL